MVSNSKKQKLKEFNNFLGGIDLVKYRKKYAHIKLVELDMPRPIQPIQLLYEYYWERFDLLDYGSFYKVYSDKLRIN